MRDVGTDTGYLLNKFYIQVFSILLTLVSLLMQEC